MCKVIPHELHVLSWYSQMLGEAGYPPDARVAAQHAVARRSSVSAIPFSTPRFAAICAG
jgi:hypothetical protein